MELKSCNFCWDMLHLLLLLVPLLLLLLLLLLLVVIDKVRGIFCFCWQLWAGILVGAAL